MDVNTKQFDNMMSKLADGVDRAWRDTGDHFKKITPVDGGNARRKTRQTRETITADYPYAGRLDEGWSSQAPDGMSGPSKEFFDRAVDELVRKL